MTTPDPLTDLSPLTLDQARALATELAQRSLADEAEQLAHGVRHLSVAHGEMETDHDTRLINTLWKTASESCGRSLLRTVMTNDTTTWHINGPHAGKLVDELTRIAASLNPGWWHIRQAAR